MKTAIDCILTGDGLDYHCLDYEVPHYPNDIAWLLYSCILYEQSKKKDAVDEHIAFWKSEKKTNDRLTEVKNLSKTIGFHGWPSELALECTTACCAKCTNCTHETLIQSGKRQVGNISYAEACYRIRKMKMFTLLFEAEKISFAPVGLGEPFCHPQILDILEYATRFFDCVEITTNAFLLDREKAERLARLPVDVVQISLSYFDKKIYEREIGMNYDTVVQNIIYYLEQRARYDSVGLVTMHIFDNSLSSKESFKKFRRFFRRYMRKDDVCSYRPYVESVKNAIKSNMDDVQLSPCPALWSTMMVDLDGNVYPCCQGVWKEYDSSLALGNIVSPIADVIDNLMRIRKEQLGGLFARGGAINVLQT